jgi:hypothetical protein
VIVLVDDQPAYRAPDNSCTTIHFFEARNFPLQVFVGGQYLGTAYFYYDNGMDLVITYDNRGDLMYWA